MNTNDIQNFKHPAITDKTDREIIFTYDLGDEEDVNRFSNKFDTIVEDLIVDAYLEISGDESEEGELPWSIVDVVVNVEFISTELLQNFIDEVDSI